MADEFEFNEDDIDWDDVPDEEESKGSVEYKKPEISQEKYEKSRQAPIQKGISVQKQASVKKERNTTKKPVSAGKNKNLKRNKKTDNSRKTKQKIKPYNPNHDHYYDDIQPDVNDKVTDFSVYDIIKVAGAVLVLVVAIVYLIYFT